MKTIREFFAMVAGLTVAAIVFALSPILIIIILLGGRNYTYTERRGDEAQD